MCYNKYRRSDIFAQKVRSGTARAHLFLCYNIINGGAIGNYHAKAQKEILWGEINVWWFKAVSVVAY